MQATWFDYYHDGTQDLFVVHDGFAESRLHRNYGFLPLIDQARATSFHDIGSGNSMGIAWGDVNGDGWEDVYITRIGEAGLYINLAGDGFLQIEDALGAWRNGMAWGTVFSDFDNDLDPDLFVVNTSGYDGTETLLYENRNGWFVDQSRTAEASFYVETQGLASWDFDLDGHMDLVFPGHDGPVRVLRGIPDNPGNWIKVSLKGTTANREAIGARVEARVGDRVVTGYVSGGDSFCSQSEPVVHLGLGDATRVDQLVVHWGGSAIETFGALSSGNHVLVQGAGAPAGTSSEPTPEIVQETPQLSAFPNPVTADTRLRVSLPRAAQVRISVFDIRGREVALVTEKVLAAGTSTVALPTDLLRSGIYFVRMETRTGVVTTAVAQLH
ncbi:MAG: T9SS type A sorting domain-containing protein [Rhodothermales bacterium]|nr:T9SS type A sorting domain-containing protein [Rhodothermales bacterium]